MAKYIAEGLFGPEPVTRRESVPKATVYRDASARWAGRFRAVYPFDYPWQGRCNRHIGQLLQWAGGVEYLDAIFVAYLADKWQGYDGHRLSALWRDRERFRARVEKSSRRNVGGIANRTNGRASDAIL